MSLLYFSANMYVYVTLAVLALGAAHGLFIPANTAAPQPAATTMRPSFCHDLECPKFTVLETNAVSNDLPCWSMCYIFFYPFKDARSVSFRSELFTSYILTIFKQRNLLP